MTHQEIFRDSLQTRANGLMVLWEHVVVLKESVVGTLNGESFCFEVGDDKVVCHQAGLEEEMPAGAFFSQRLDAFEKMVKAVEAGVLQAQ